MANRNIIWSQFCALNETFWDTDKFWNTSIPTFSHCFQQTVSSVCPALFMATILPFEIYLNWYKHLWKRPKIYKRYQKISWNWYNLTRVISIITLIMAKVTHFGLELIQPEALSNSRNRQINELTLVDLLNVVLIVITFATLAVILSIHQRIGRHTSGNVWFFTLISLVTAIPSVYMGLLVDRSRPSTLKLSLLSIHFSTTLLLFILSCFADPRTTVSLSKVADKKFLSGKPSPNSVSLLRENPKRRASFLSLVTFSWITPLMWRGYRQTLSLDDIWALDRTDTTQYLINRLDNKHRKANGGKGLVFGSIFRSFAGEFAKGGVLKLLPDFVQYLSPLMLKTFIVFIADPKQPLWHGLAMAGGLFFANCLGSLAINSYFLRMFHLASRFHATLVAAIYRKSLRLSNTALKRITTGEIINLMTVDATRLMETVSFANLVWSGPLQLVVLTYCLYVEIGVSVFAGIGAVLVLFPLSWYLNSLQRVLQTRQLHRKDERVKVIAEVLAGMRAIKLHGWETAFAARIATIRDEEIVQLRQLGHMNVFNTFLWTTAPFVVSFVTFTTYVLSSEHNVLDARKAFVSLSLFNLMQFPLAILPRVVTSAILFRISTQRLDRYFAAPEIDQYVQREAIEGEPNLAVVIQDGSFAWEFADTDSQGVVNCDTRLILRDMNLSVNRGELVAIVGEVGAGKSSLLSAIVGDMERIAGAVKVAPEFGDQFGYVTQQAWILNTTLRENIIFGQPFNLDRYDRVVRACALAPDISLLPAGSETEIGENGVNLSGGQKQRVALARACYWGIGTGLSANSCRMFLLDDPLSAVDSKVGRHIFQRVLSNRSESLLAGSTRLLVTNNLNLLSEVDRIVVMANGTVSAVGTFGELNTDGGLKNYIKKLTDDLENESVVDKLQQERLWHLEDPEDGLTERAQLIQVEQAETGHVKASVYLYYLRSMATHWLTLVLVGFIGMQLFSVGANLWLAIWSNDYLVDYLMMTPPGLLTDDPGSTVYQNQETIASLSVSLRNYRLLVFGLFGVATGVFVLFGSLAKERAMVQSSVNLHQKLLTSVMSAPIHFFDTTPIGRILNRFSRDIDAVDNRIPSLLQSWLTSALVVLLTLGLLVTEIPWFTVVMVPLLLFYHYVQKFYVSTSRQLRRLESVTKSPVYSFFSETLAGLSTIRAFHASDRFMTESNRRIDQSQISSFPGLVASKWLAARLEFCGNLVVFSTTLFTVFSRESFTHQPGHVGLIITYALNITQMIYWMVRMWSDLETAAVSVERIQDYCDHIPQEAAQVLAPANNQHSVDIGQCWPQFGAIRFVNYSVRYRATLEPALQELNLNIGAGEKVGIVGRTGSGKSTLTLALFRLLEPDSGAIFIDGVNIGELGLHNLRSRLSIIPQNPVLFSGTVRFNLDPFQQHTDAELWQAIDQCHLRSWIASLEPSAGLDYQLSEGGSNLSLGQRQLLCLGRALLRRSKILVLDEATASVDMGTDSLIQQTIRTEFSHCTVLTVAHRLRSILDSDRVLVMDQGKVVEFDTPTRLLADCNTRFYSLAKGAGIV